MSEYRLHTSIASQLFAPVLLLLAVPCLGALIHFGKIPWSLDLDAARHENLLWRLFLIWIVTSIWWPIDRLVKPHTIELDDRGTVRFHRLLGRTKGFVAVDVRSIELRRYDILITGILGDKITVAYFARCFEVVDALMARNPKIQPTDERRPDPTAGRAELRPPAR